MDFLGDDFLIGLALVFLAGYLLRELYDWAINWADKQEKQAKRDKGFITPPKPDKPEGPPGPYKRFDAWFRRNLKKSWAALFFIWILIFGDNTLRMLAIGLLIYIGICELFRRKLAWPKKHPVLTYVLGFIMLIFIAAMWHA